MAPELSVARVQSPGVPEQIDELAVKASFKPLENFYDSKKWFTDVLWEVV